MSPAGARRRAHSLSLIAAIAVSLSVGAAIAADPAKDVRPGYVNRAMGLGEVRKPERFTREQRLLEAVRTNDRATVERALELGVDVESRDDLGRSALLLAARDAQDPELVAFLHAQGAEPDVADVGGRTPLSWSAARGRLDLMRVLIDAGATIDSVDGQGRTPLFYAAIGNHPEAVRFLAERGAAIDVSDRREETPLIGACAKAANEAAQTLLELGADPERRDSRGRTAQDRARGLAPACALVSAEPASVPR